MATLATVLSPAAPAVAAVSSEQAVAFLNQQRAVNGIPGDLVADADLALGCRNHNYYMELHGIGHGEQLGQERYTPEGAGEPPYGGGSEVLAYGGYDGSGKNPWEWAPIHLYLMLDPARTSAGYDEGYGFSCMRLLGNRESSDRRFFSYPGPGTSGIYPIEYAYESPYTPQELVGIPEGQATGPNILLFSYGGELGSQVEVERFSLTGPAGPIPARMVEENTSNEVGSGFWFAGGGVLIPEQPLAEFTTYEVAVEWLEEEVIEFGAGTVKTPHAQRFSFTTGSNPLDEGMANTESRRSRVRGATLRFRLLGGSGGTPRLHLVASRSLIGRVGRVEFIRERSGCRPGAGSPMDVRRRVCGWHRIGGQRVRRVRLRRRLQPTGIALPQGRRERVVLHASTRTFMRDGYRVASAQTGAVLRRHGLRLRRR